MASQGEGVPVAALAEVWKLQGSIRAGYGGVSGLCNFHLMTAELLSEVFIVFVC